MKKVIAWCVVLVAMLAAGSPAMAQDFRGRINGTLTDNTGAVLPGVTVTATSPALIQAAGPGHGDRRRLPVPGAAARASTS